MRLCSRTCALLLIFGLANGSANTQPSSHKVFLSPPTSLQFEGRVGGQVFPELNFNFRNTTGKVICVYESMWPGTHEFDATTVEFKGPQGNLEPTEFYLSELGKSRVHFPYAARFVVIYPKANVVVGYMFAKNEYVFNIPGRYVATFRVPIYDCSNLIATQGKFPDSIGWYLGDLVAEAAALLK